MNKLWLTRTIHPYNKKIRNWSTFLLGQVRLQVTENINILTTRILNWDQSDLYIHELIHTAVKTYIAWLDWSCVFTWGHLGCRVRNKTLGFLLFQTRMWISAWNKRAKLNTIKQKSNVVSVKICRYTRAKKQNLLNSLCIFLTTIIQENY